MSMKDWERSVLKHPGAAERVAEIEDELRLAAGLTALRENAGLSQRDLAERMRVSQPRVVAIERSRNVTIGVLEQYVGAIGGQLELTVKTDGKRFNLLSGRVVGGAQRSAAPKAVTSKAPASKVPARKIASSRMTTAKVAPRKKSVTKKTI